MTQPTTAAHRLATAAPKAAPAIATTTVLALARIWNAHGAEHSIGNAILMSTLATGAAAAGAFSAAGRHGDPTLSAAAFGTSGAFALAGVAAYADDLPLPLLLWTVATVLAHVLAARYWREDHRDTVAHERRMAQRREDQQHVESIELIRARAQVEVAREGTAYAAALAEALTARAALPGFDPAALANAGLPELPTSTAIETAATKES